MAKGLIQYTDGSARPNPGNAGYGIHGYYYDTEKPKKGSGHKTHILTSAGYRSKLDIGAKDIEVTPIEYIDTVGSIIAPATNNVAELKAAIEALKNTAKYEINNLTILSDSKMVVEGSNNWIYSWQKYNWKKKDGSPLSNVHLWQEIYQLKNDLKTKNIDVKFDWVMGHGDNPGNIIADKLSVIGTMRSKKDSFIVQEDKRPPEGYWKYEVDKSPLIDSSALLFNTLEGYNQAGLYFLSNKHKEEDMIGAPVSDSAYSVVKLFKPDPSIELIRKYQSDVCDHGKRDLIVLARLDNLYNPDINKDIMEYGSDVLIRDKEKRWDLFHAGSNEPITRILLPPKLAARAIEELSFLLYRLEQYEQKDESLTLTDITDLFYESVEVTKKKVIVKETKLKENIVVGQSSIKVNVNYRQKDIVKQTELILSLSADLIGRNALKRIEGHNPKITVLTWEESDLMIKHATIIECDDGISISASVYSNLKLLT